MTRLIVCLIVTWIAASCGRPMSSVISPERRFQLYDIAWNRGLSDQLTPLPADWTRYREKLAPYADLPGREAIFSTGYADGFSQHPEEQRDVTEMAYDEGYRSGRRDEFAHKVANVTTSVHDHKASERGYRDGFDGRPHAFGRPY